jgi:type II secretory pathway pseudopilin PulG
MLRIGLGILRSRQFRELVIIGVIGAAALAGLARENQARARARVAAWDQRQHLRHQRTATARPV